MDRRLKYFQKLLKQAENLEKICISSLTPDSTKTKLYRASIHTACSCKSGIRRFRPLSSLPLRVRFAPIIFPVLRLKMEKNPK